MDCSVGFKYAKNALADPTVGELTTLPRSLTQGQTE